MHHQKKNQRKSPKNTLDYLLYTLAGSVLAVMSFSFLLWLKL